MTPTKRPGLPRAAAIIGALLSALAVVYATSLFGAVFGSCFFFGFYRQLGPAPQARASSSAPGAPFGASRRDRHRAA